MKICNKFEINDFLKLDLGANSSVEIPDFDKIYVVNFQFSHYHI
jgi:hypothetical protein